MRSFLKIFFASFLATLVFAGICLVILLVFVTGLTSRPATVVSSKSVLVIDLSQNFSDRKTENPIVRISGDKDAEIPSLYELIRLVRKAATDSSIRGIYLKCNSNANGFASSEELRNVLLEFKKSRKFILAYGDYISQKAYYVANAADKIYCNPKGSLDWRGFTSQLFFIKQTLQKLEIQPQIFYDGKYKSATEPLREVKMSDANRYQTEIWLGELYQQLLVNTAEARGIDTTTLHRYANEYRVQTAADALRYGLVDGLKYDDEVKDELALKLGLQKNSRISFILPGSYADAVSIRKFGTMDRVAVIYAEGDIVYGRGEFGQIGSDEYRNLIRKARTDRSIKAIVLRVNSPGGSSLASEIIWRELSLAAKDGKPVVVSMGDLAASGGYYISCGADSIFAQPNTITGSIGVFGIIPNMQGFFNKKLGVTFDQVKTGPYADMGSVTRPLTDVEKKFIQNEIDTIYRDFKSRVADGREKDISYIDSIAQGRVWTGKGALKMGLVDRLGSLDDAIACAARMAKISDYGLREYPEPRSLWDILMSGYQKTVRTEAIQEELGEQGFRIYQHIKRVKAMSGTAQARLPFDIMIDEK